MRLETEFFPQNLVSFYQFCRLRSARLTNRTFQTGSKGGARSIVSNGRADHLVIPTPRLRNQ